MNARKNKLITPGIFMVFSAIFYVLHLIYRAIRYSDLNSFYIIDWYTMIPLVIGHIAIGAYCIILYNKKIGRVVYCVGFGLLALARLFSEVFFYFPLTRLDAYIISVFLLIVSYALMIVARIKSSKSICIVCISTICGSILTTVFEYLYIFIRGYFFSIAPFYFLYIIAMFAGLIMLWWSEIGNIYLRKRNAVKFHRRINPISNTYSIEVELKALKESYDLGLINESEYNEKKAALLEKI